MSPDIINSLFLSCGSFFVILSIIKACKTSLITGISILTPIYFFLWSMWNIYFFYSCSMTISVITAIIFAGCNGIWLYLVWRFREQ